MKFIKGDLFNHDTSNTIIAHVVNDRGAMGSGFVLPLIEKYPLVLTEYKKWNDHIGTWSSTYHGIEAGQGSLRQGVTQMVLLKADFYVANMCAQTLGKDRNLNYGHLATCMAYVSRFAKKFNFEIVCPLFGMDRAGGNPDFVMELVNDIWTESDNNVTMYYQDNNQHLIEKYLGDKNV